MTKELDAERDKDIYWSIDNYELHLFKSYLADLDMFLENEMNECRAGIERSQHTRWLTVDDEEHSDGNEVELLNYDYALSKTEGYCNLFLKSFVTSLYTFLESGLATRCRKIERDNHYLLTIKDLAGKGISQSMSFLVKLHHINYPLEKSIEWSQIQNFRRLRNCIVHNGGRLDEGTEQIRQLQSYIKSESTLKIEDGTNEIIVSREYCESALLTVERFLYAIDKAIKVAESAA